MSRYGALGATFYISRLFQACSLIAIIGMTAKFISVIVSTNATPPNIVIGTISVVCIIHLYILIYEHSKQCKKKANKVN
jgi:hypothetical protein